ncbi:MAG: serine/threonine protein kinase [Acidobacteria bacterium]|nr:MAG: serine/threonine protein kinase [Acidobacteriota bacterium]PYR47085.1 MAG: serine/threonine protein kinase [Acidobacteriota bacterium]
MTRALLVGLLFGLLTLPAASATEQWPRFRGTQNGAVADDPSLPDTWSETENVVWKTAIPGMGWSSPVVWDDHIFITSAISAGQEKPPVAGLYDEHDHVKAAAEQRWVVYDIDFKTGRIRWQRELRAGQPPLLRHVKNSYASETVVTDGDRVYVYFGSIGLVAALDMNGKPVWTKEFDAFNTQVELGTGASPVLYKDRLYVVNDNTTRSYLAAYDKKTGKEAWRVDRDERGNWSTPFIWENPLRTEIVTAGTVEVRSYGLDGKLLWKLKGMTSLTIPSPFSAHGLVYISSGYPGASPRPVYAIRPGGTGDISLGPDETESEYVAWYQPLLGTYNTSALVYGDYYYTLLDRGFLLCHDARTGKQIYGRQRIAPGVSGFTTSPWAYNGKIFLLSEDGDTFVVPAGPEFRVVGKNSLNEMALATPAIIRGSVILRTQSKLYRIARTNPK